jgi:hypothetical protein
MSSENVAENCLEGQGQKSGGPRPDSIGLEQQGLQMFKPIKKKFKPPVKKSPQAEKSQDEIAQKVNPSLKPSNLSEDAHKKSNGSPENNSKEAVASIDATVKQPSEYSGKGYDGNLEELKPEEFWWDDKKSQTRSGRIDQAKPNIGEAAKQGRDGMVIGQRTNGKMADMGTGFDDFVVKLFEDALPVGQPEGSAKGETKNFEDGRPKSKETRH